MKLTVLIDNNTYIDNYFLGEPAVSYYIEDGENKVLFDTGYSDAFMKNAEKMNIDLSKLTHIVISHGHNDHTNGLKFLSDKFGLKSVKLISHPDCFLPRYDENEYIGAPFGVSEIASLCNYIPSMAPYELSENLIFLGEIPRLNDFESQDAIGIIEKENVMQSDFVLDDSAIVYKSTDGFFIITGCSHSGICNIIDYAKKICKQEHILGILGGFHLLDDMSRTDKTIEYLKACNIDMIYPCHCVSLASKARIMNALPVTEVGVGMKIEQ